MLHADSESIVHTLTHTKTHTHTFHTKHYSNALALCVVTRIFLFLYQELMPEALRLQRHLVTLGGFVTGCAVMGTSLYLLE